jgi:hypothetical protein
VAQLPIGNFNGEILSTFMTQLYAILSPNADIRTTFSAGTEQEKNFLLHLAMFFCTFMSAHRKDLEQGSLAKMVVDGHIYLAQLSTVDDIRVFRVCLDYWSRFTTSPGDLLSYTVVLSKVRDVVISRMTKPDNVALVKVAKKFNNLADTSG